MSSKNCTMIVQLLIMYEIVYVVSTNAKLAEDANVVYSSYTYIMMWYVVYSM